MKRPDVRYAVVSREWGLRRVRRLTWGIAGAGAYVQGSRAPAAEQGSGGNQQPVGGGQLRPPAANPLPARGPAHVVSGGS